MHIKTPIYEDTIKRMKAGDIVYISGTIYTGRDQAHKKMVEALNANQPLPFDFSGQVIYYVGPTPAKSGQPIGSCGPTSSYRMDPFAKPLMEKGLKVMIGKGDRRWLPERPSTPCWSSTFSAPDVDKRGRLRGGE